MEIGPVHSIRPVPPVRPSPPGSSENPDLSGVFAAEFRGQQRDDAYAPSRKPVRGLEDEDEDEEAAEEPALEWGAAETPSSISLVA